MSRFESRYELASINRGIADELQENWGQTALWYIFDASNTYTDAIYDVASEVQGAAWNNPLLLPVVSTRRVHGDKEFERGLYSADTISLVLLIDQIQQAGLADIVSNTDNHLKDRFTFDHQVWSPMNIDVRGLVDHTYVVIGLQARQVNPDELINDATFQAFAS